MLQECIYCKKMNIDHHLLLCLQLKNVAKINSNVAKKVLTNGAEQKGRKLPTLLFTTYIRSKKGKVGTLIDDGSTDHYFCTLQPRK